MKSALAITFLLAALRVGQAGEHASANYRITAETFDSGGGQTSSANYHQDGSSTALVGGGSISTTTARHGYIGQLYDLNGLAVYADQNARENEAAGQLYGYFQADDSSTIYVPGSEVAWSILSGPITSISTAGIMAAELVYQTAPASIRGTARGFTANLTLSVLDTIPDNFGTYAGDGLPDDWQYQYFGADNPLAAPDADATGTGQTNRFKYIAGLNPIDRNAANAVFKLTIADIPSEPGHKALTFSPRYPDRSYTVIARSSLTAGDWVPITDFTTSDATLTRTVTDRGAAGPTQFYRVQITKP